MILSKCILLSVPIDSLIGSCIRYNFSIHSNLNLFSLEISSNVETVPRLERDAVNIILQSCFLIKHVSTRFLIISFMSPAVDIPILIPL